MEKVKDVLSKFKDNLDGVIVDFKNRISEIEKEEEFIHVLSDLVNYSKSDSLLLPFYDETILSRVFERIFPLSNTELNKIKTAKYLIDACKDINKDKFPQYKEAVSDVEEINTKINSFYEKILSDDNLVSEKENLNSKVEKFSIVFDNIGEDKFNSLIEDIDSFEETIDSVSLSSEEINVLLNIAIRSNLEYLDSSGIVVNTVDNEIVEENNIIQDKISDLSNLLGDEQEVFYET